MTLSIPVKLRGSNNLGSSKSRVYRSLGFIPCSISTLKNYNLNVIVDTRKIDFLLRRGVKLLGKPFILKFIDSTKTLNCTLKHSDENPLCGKIQHLDFIEN